MKKVLTMADVKWIKITTDIFDDEKILLIESLPDAYAIITVWFKLLCLAGKQNNNGVFLMGRIAYTDKMLATIFRMNELTVKIEAKGKASVILGFELEPLIPTPTLSFGSDGKLGFVSEVYSHQSLFGEKIEKELSKYSLKATENGDTVSYELKMNRKATCWTDNTPFRIRMKVGGAPLKKTKIGLRLLAKWEEYPDTHVWVIPESHSE
jgi:hypothetical protein